MSDSFGYNVALNGVIPREDWMFGVTAGLGSSDTSQTETAQQVRSDYYNASLTAVYGGRRRLSYELGLDQNIELNEDFNNNYRWSTMDWVNYALTAKTSVGFGLGAGYTMVETAENPLVNPGTDSIHERIQGRFAWHPSHKLSVSFSGGAQIQQFLVEERRIVTPIFTNVSPAEVINSVSPIFSLSAGYLPVDGTSFSLSASHSIGSSISSDQYTEATTFSLGYHQRLFKHLNLIVTPNYSLTDYHSSTDPNAPPRRSDEVLAINVALSTVLFKKLATSIFFNFTDNRSDEDLYAYETRQFGFQVGYRF
jgi:hypothetical protein